MGQAHQTVDLASTLRGDVIPADHGYSLYSAITRVLPDVHSDYRIGIHPVRGGLVGSRQLAVTAASRLVFRTPVDRIPGLLRMAGQWLDLNGAVISVGVPTVRALRPAPALSNYLRPMSCG